MTSQGDLIGTTPIPSTLGTTITGAISNLNQGTNLDCTEAIQMCSIRNGHSSTLNYSDNYTANHSINDFKFIYAYVYADYVEQRFIYTPNFELLTSESITDHLEVSSRGSFHNVVARFYESTYSVDCKNDGQIYIGANLYGLNSNFTNLSNKVGNTDISAIGSTITGAIKNTNNDIAEIGDYVELVRTDSQDSSKYYTIQNINDFRFIRLSLHEGASGSDYTFAADTLPVKLFKTTSYNGNSWIRCQFSSDWANTCYASDTTIRVWLIKSTSFPRRAVVEGIK